MRTFNGLDEFGQAVGTELGRSDWHTVTQAQIDLFAEATDDHQWIHTDPAKAADGPFGTTIAHGYLVLSLIPMLIQQIYAVEGLSMAVNYGSDKVRYPAPVPSGSRVRAAARLIALDRGATSARATVRVSIEREGGDKPVCVAEIVAMLVP